MKRGLIFGLIAAIGLSAMPTLVNAAPKIKVGVLRCDVAGGTGFILGSSKELSCTYTPAGSGPIGTYKGRINRFGLDIGRTRASQLVWGVLAPSKSVGPEALAGEYGGVSVEATAGVGLGANAMIGGFQKSIALQPVSLQTQQGVDIAAGISSLTLTPQ
ncbi:MAG: DUF992 domain-containing protein [Phycisphaerales bacterium]|nr:DUF992 domain-containing protein [Phycisphaerales bacterium]